MTTDLTESHPVLSLTAEAPLRLTTTPGEAVTPLEASAPVAAAEPLCRCCETPLAEVSEFEVCSECEGLISTESASVLNSLGSLTVLGSPNRIEDARRSLSVLYASIFLGTNADKIARFLGMSRSAARQYGMRFRAAKIWNDGEATGPWAKKTWLAPAFCRLLFMDALVGAGEVMRGKDRWDFIEGSAEAA